MPYHEHVTLMREEDGGDISSLIGLESFADGKYHEICDDIGFCHKSFVDVPFAIVEMLRNLKVIIYATFTHTKVIRNVVKLSYFELHISRFHRKTEASGIPGGLLLSGKHGPQFVIPKSLEANPEEFSAHNIVEMWPALRSLISTLSCSASTKDASDSRPMLLPNLNYTWVQHFPSATLCSENVAAWMKLLPHQNTGVGRLMAQEWLVQSPWLSLTLSAKRHKCVCLSSPSPTRPHPDRRTKSRSCACSVSVMVTARALVDEKGHVSYNQFLSSVGKACPSWMPGGDHNHNRSRRRSGDGDEDGDECGNHGESGLNVSFVFLRSKSTKGSNSNPDSNTTSISTTNRTEVNTIADAFLGHAGGAEQRRRRHLFDHAPLAPRAHVSILCTQAPMASPLAGKLWNLQGKDVERGRYGLGVECGGGSTRNSSGPRPDPPSLALALAALRVHRDVEEISNMKLRVRTVVGHRENGHSFNACPASLSPLSRASCLNAIPGNAIPGKVVGVTEPIPSMYRIWLHSYKLKIVPRDYIRLFDEGGYDFESVFGAEGGEAVNISTPSAVPLNEWISVGDVASFRMIEGGNSVAACAHQWPRHPPSPSHPPAPPSSSPTRSEEKSDETAFLCFGSLSWSLRVPPGHTLLTEFIAMKTFLTRESQLPDSSRGMEMPPAYFTLHECPPNSAGRDVGVHVDVNAPGCTVLHVHASAPTLLSTPFPDASMPFNVITLVSTLMAFLLGSMINSLVRKNFSPALPSSPAPPDPPLGE